ncbi:glycosyltransferase family 4 protein [Tenacibaculum crassostreae]|uniref:glycosyltransferase family 4 protein n=1 Tax=Tenacibaculum crassostreae TaxID=502683 RepID=UPI00389562A8
MKHKLICISTVAISLNYLLKGQLSFLNERFEVVAVSGADEHLQEVEKREEVRVVSVPMKRNISPFQDLRSLWKLYCLFLKERPVMVHSITPKAGLLTMLAGKMAGVPIRIHTFTGLIFPSRRGSFQKLLILMDKLLCWSATNVYPEGQGVKEDLEDYKITTKKLKVLANGNVNGIDIDYFYSKTVSQEDKNQLKKELQISDDDFVFVFVGRLVADKGINELVNAFTKLSKEKKNIKLLLVGPFESDLDPLENETLNKIDNNKNIISVGFQKDVRSYFAIANVLTFPSYREGFPNVVMQAGAMDLPSIVSNINGCNEIIEEGKNGVIIPVKDSEAIYAAMKRLIEDEDFYKELKTNAREMIIARYEQKIVWNALLEEYNTLLKEKGYAV